MLHPYITQELAREQVRDRLRFAAQRRQARDAQFGTARGGRGSEPEVASGPEVARGCCPPVMRGLPDGARVPSGHEKLKRKSPKHLDIWDKEDSLGIILLTGERLS